MPPDNIQAIKDGIEELKKGKESALLELKKNPNDEAWKAIVSMNDMQVTILENLLQSLEKHQNFVKELQRVNKILLKQKK